MAEIKLATEKQIAYAAKISSILGVHLPKEKTAYAYWKFISENQAKYKKEMQDRYTNAASEFYEAWMPESEFY